MTSIAGMPRAALRSLHFCVKEVSAGSHPPVRSDPVVLSSASTQLALALWPGQP
ncbi:hypothetical protein I79_009058 [Cricetulus griseus]|uniref:Uncharacterized protein n=1 Tax=Cricetulus griseus TaxID=10029 RepID=G3HER4_CRIGR|nr:hypothetical protein I79_009058 [Cricetulus griseus]